MNIEEQCSYLCDNYDSNELELLITLLKKEVQKQFRHFIIMDNDIVRSKVCELIDQGIFQYARDVKDQKIYIYTGRSTKYSVNKLNKLIDVPGTKAASIKTISFIKGTPSFEHGKRMNMHNKIPMDRDTASIKNLIIETIQEYTTTMNQESMTG
jgi:hypothetical protein